MVNVHQWESPKSATLKDVATAVGVSTSAASIVLNGSKSGTRVSPATREALMRAARTLGYRPNSLAQSLASGNTHRIGVYSGVGDLDSRNIFYAEILSALIAGAGESGANLLLHSTGNNGDDLLDLVSNRSADGLVVHLRPQDPLISILSELRVPAVAICDDASDLPSVVVDDAAGGRMQAEHLARLGHRTVLFRDAYRPLNSVEARKVSFLNAAAEWGIEVLVHVTRIQDGHPLEPGEIAALTGGSGRATACVCWEDGCAHATCHFVSDLGLRVPEDVSVIGFNGIDPSFAPRFDLTTVRAPWFAVARTAIHQLTTLINGGSVPLQTVLPVEFYPGATCAPLSSTYPPHRGMTQRRNHEKKTSHCIHAH